jgi:hypothetical protein
MLAQDVAGEVGVTQIVVRIVDDIDLPMALRLPVDRPSVACLAVGQEHEIERRWLAQVRDVEAAGVVASGERAKLVADLLDAPGDEDRGGGRRAVVSHGHIDTLAQAVGDADEEDRWIDSSQAHSASPIPRDAMELEYLLLRKIRAEETQRILALIQSWPVEVVESDAGWRHQAATPSNPSTLLV